MLQRSDLLAEVANALAQHTALIAQPLKLAIRFHRPSEGERAVEHLPQNASGVSQGVDPAARLEQAGVDALGQQPAGSVQSRRTLGFGGAESLLQASQLAPALGELLSAA